MSGVGEWEAFIPSAELFFRSPEARGMVADQRHLAFLRLGNGTCPACNGPARLVRGWLRCRAGRLVEYQERCGRIVYRARRRR